MFCKANSIYLKILSLFKVLKFASFKYFKFLSLFLWFRRISQELSGEQMRDAAKLRAELNRARWSQEQLNLIAVISTLP